MSVRPQREARRACATAGLLAVALAVGACRGLLEVGSLPADLVSEQSDAAMDPGTRAEAEASSVRDPAWAAWRVPPDGRPRLQLTEGVARDETTNLVWQRASGAAASWAEGEAYCAQLDLGGRAGWRLPTRIELMSIMDFRSPEGGHPFPPVFVDPESSCYWSISRDADRAHWLLATASPRLGVSASDDERCVSRCVQGSPYDPDVNVPPDYVVANGVVQDPLTHLEWQAYASSSAGERVSLEEAERRCAELELGAHDDWRLPSLKELSTLVDERRLWPAFDPRVTGESSVYWSSTLHAPTVGGVGERAASRQAWRVSFSDGASLPADDDLTFPAGLALARCVRGL